MTRDDIIRMAREAGIEYSKNLNQMVSPYCDGVHMDELEKFINLVEAAEREACAKMCEAIEDDEFYWGRQYAEMLRAREQG
jgi:hypothetical protein